ncbi:SNF2 family N-terminal domain-containing protein [Lentinula lateritia]|uniref:SNF2 family N-terminal domain-containing protein n=1 Tax=Lentinula aff. lateritia TaxID=2804960 RepID=A0ACC1U0S5_9AGAR|nr:SNF2 family N-terminal domain-containing protein [Lentinula aff. lateritia]KAJ3855108.1 SNF2 family N-terminal domain-containing protein [Lentinula lateritia]
MSSHHSESGEIRGLRSSRGSRRQDARQPAFLAKARGHELESDFEEGGLEDTRKNSLIAEKEAELSQIYEGHDSLVREAFHMEHFRMMLSYNPAVPKQDHSAVFQNYKSNYDLLETASASAPGPSRRTRRAHTERKNLLLPESSSFSPAANDASESRPAINSSPLNAKSVDSLSNLSSSSKAKGKRKAIDATQDAKSSSLTRSSRSKRRNKGDAELDDSNACMDLASTINRVHTNHPDISIPKPTRPSGILLRVPPRSSIIAPPSESSSVNEFDPIRSPRKITLRGSRPTTEILPQFSSLHTNLLLLVCEYDMYLQPPTDLVTSFQASLPPIKRIKLIVRRPAPLVSSPLQRPLPPKYNYSLTDFLSSYVTDGSEEVPPDTLAERARTRTEFLERTQKLREEGRLLDDLSVSELTPTETANKQRKSYDIWYHCIVDVAAYLESKSEETSGVEIAGQIAKAIQNYWDTQTVKQEKMKVQEEKRIRALAKATIKLVVSEWKKAVFHLREQERLELVAEEVRRGRAHLDAILDQSGHILETQHGDLTRLDRARSHSRGSSISDWTENDSEDETEDRKEEKDENKETCDDSVIGVDKEEGNSKEGASVISHARHDFSIEEVDQSTVPDIVIDTDSVGGREASSASDYHGPFDDSLHSSLPLLGTSEPVSIFAKPFNQPWDFISFNTDEVLPPINSSTLSPPFHLDQPLDGDTSSPSTADVVTPPNEFEASIPIVGLASLQRGEFMSETLPIKANSGGLGLEESFTSLAVEPFPAVDPNKLTLEPSNGDGESIEYSSLQTQDEEDSDDQSQEAQFPSYLTPYIVTHVDWNPDNKIAPPVLLRGVLRPYQFAGLEWLASLHSNNLNGILADEMGLGKTIQTISLLAHLACDRGIWGPHLIIVPTSVLLNWEMEFKKFLPGFRILCYHGTTKRRKELRHGWNDKYHFNVCITSYTLASRDAHIFKRKNWYYMVLDEAHMIKNFKSQRWNTLLLFRSFRRLLLTGTPLQNNLTELWALLQFLMSGAKFANLKEFGEWFSNPLEKAIEMGNVHDDETKQRVSKLHTVLRPYLLRRLKRDVEKELPNKYEHLVLCSLSKRQRFLYDEFMARAHTRDALRSGVYQKIANILMQLRKVCNHPDLFEVRPIVTSFVMDRSAVADFEIKELLIRRQFSKNESEELDLELLGLSFINLQNTSIATSLGTRAEAAGAIMMRLCENPGPAPPRDVRRIENFRQYTEWQRRASLVARWSHTAYLNRLRYSRSPIYSSETLSLLRSMYNPIIPLCHVNTRTAAFVDTVLPSLHKAVLSYEERSNEMSNVIDRFAFITSNVVARDVARFALASLLPSVLNSVPLTFDDVLHRSAVKLSIAFPPPSLLQYDCGKLQRLTALLREKKAGGHRVLLFTQMTKILDILEIYLNFHGYLYLRLDGATSIEDRQYVTERFNKDEKIFCFIASSRSGGVGINLTGADTVIFYDSDFNPQMDRQCEDRAHRIGQIRDVHIYRFISEHTVEEAMLLKANQKRFLDDIVIQKGGFDWGSIFKFDSEDEASNIEVAQVQRGIDSGLLTKALGEFEDSEDSLAARIAEREEVDMEGADKADFGLGVVGGDDQEDTLKGRSGTMTVEEGHEGDNEDVEEDGGTTVDYMLAFIARDIEFFAEWRL